MNEKSNSNQMAPMRVGVVGCGNISSLYFEKLKLFPEVQIVACSDIDLQRAQASAEKFNIPQALELEDFFDADGIDLVVNLTIPSAHAEVALRALRAGRHVYNEKPLAIKRSDARKMIEYAQKRGLRIGCAPDTALNTGLQTARRLIDSGSIGNPVAATAFFMSLGPEIWHPSPEFLYKKGAGPLFDMGPYYITALVHLLGGVKRVSGVARASFPERVIGRGPSQGRKFAVEVPTHIAAHLEFNSGPIATLITSFDIKAHNLPSIVVYGSERTLSIPDPIFGGVLRIGKPGPAGKPGTEEWEEVPFDREHLNNARGIGVVDMIRAIHAGVDHRCNERVGYHVLDVMHSIIDSAKRGRHLEISSAVVRPDAMPF